MSRVRSVAARLRAQVARPGATVVGITVLTNLVRFGSSLILTRLLAPQDFGAVAIITAVSYIATMATDLGFEAFVIRSKEGAEPRFLDVIWTLRVLRGVLAAALIVALSGPFSHLVAKPELQLAIAASAFAPLLAAAQSMAIISAERARRVPIVLSFALFALVTQTVATLLFATVVKSYWAVICGMAASGVINAAASYMLFRGSARKIVFDARISRDLWRFARYVVPASLLALLVSQSDKVVLGRALSIDSFGLYALALSLISAGGQLVSTFVRTVQFPLYAQTNRDSPERLGETFYQSRRKMAALIGFLMGGGIGGAETIVRLLYEDRYAGAAPMLALLCAAPIIAIGAQCAESLLVVVGRLRSVMEGGFIRLLWVAVMAPLALHFGGPLAAVAVFALIDLPVWAYYSIHVARRGMFRPHEEAIPIATALAGASVGWAGTLAIKAMVAAGWLPDF